MIPINATLINLYHVCHRELWLHAHHIRMEHTSSIVSEGRFIGETTYDRRSESYEQIELDGIKIDYYYERKNQIVYETKKSDKVNHAI